MENNFKGTIGQVEILEYINDLEIGTLQSTLICTLPSKTDEYLVNAQLITDAFKIRQQINFDLPELLERYNKAVELLEKSNNILNSIKLEMLKSNSERTSLWISDFLNSDIGGAKISNNIEQFLKTLEK